MGPSTPTPLTNGGVAIHFDQAAKVLSGDMTSTRILGTHRPKY